MSYKEQSYTAACYCRLSRDDLQDGTSVSIETQRKVLEDYCKNNGYGIFDFYCDDGFTGVNFDRPNYKRMMSDINNGLVNTIIVKDLSRFGRNYIEVGKYIEEIFPEMGVRFIAIGDDVDTERENMDLDLMLPMKNIFNQYYPADCSRKTRQAFKTKAQRGEFIGSFAPFGYRKSAEDKHVLEIDSETAPIVKQIFEMAAYSGYGYNKIARVLCDEKVMTPSAFQAVSNGIEYSKNPYDWNLATVRVILENQVYLGHTVNCKKRKLSFKSKKVIRQPKDKWIIVENTHRPIISERLWKEAHKCLDSRKRTSKTTNVNIFAGLLRCDTCGCALGVANSSQKKNYYSCNTYKRKGKDACSIHYIPFDELYELVLSDIKEKLRFIRTDSEGFVTAVMNKLDSTDSKYGSYVKEAEKLKKRIDELDKKFDILYEDRLNSTISEKKFKELSGKCEAEQEKLQKRLDELDEIISRRKHAADEVSTFVDEITKYNDIDELDAEILNRLIDKIIVSDRVKTENGYAQLVSIFYKFVGDLSNVTTK